MAKIGEDCKRARENPPARFIGPIEAAAICGAITGPLGGLILGKLFHLSKSRRRKRFWTHFSVDFLSSPDRIKNAMKHFHQLSPRLKDLLKGAKFPSDIIEVRHRLCEKGETELRDELVEMFTSLSNAALAGRNLLYVTDFLKSFIAEMKEFGFPALSSS